MRVEFEGAEVYWALSDNYTFEMLQQDSQSVSATLTLPRGTGSLGRVHHPMEGWPCHHRMMLPQDAARYWDLSTMDVVLYDESGAIWPSDAYVALEMQQQPTARIAMRVKPVAATIEEEVRSRETACDGAATREIARDFTCGTYRWRCTAKRARSNLTRTTTTRRRIS